MLKSSIAIISGLSLLLIISTAHGATKHHRVVWDSDPSSAAVIGFSPDGTTNSPYVNYGFTTNESLWVTSAVNNTQTFASSLTSHFVRLTGLPADSAVYYRLCDQSGCGQRFWFKTAPSNNAPFVAVAGGDTRTGWNTRRAGNRLIAKIRPLFIMHGGDFTDSNSASQMNQYLSDWALTYSNDTIDGNNYKRIYPLIPTHGNHEDNDFRTLCRVFGVDYNGDGQCNNSDTFGAFNISPLLRVYTLNSQYQRSGWSSYASAMNNWLTGDLSSSGNSAVWRFAQYHKPMFPHYSGKSDNPRLHDWWSRPFYDYSMNMVVESDTHISKLTEAIAPSGNGFAATQSGGTIYVGEGSWGAPTRSANDAKSWTIDMASIQQFKVITVQPDKLEVRTAQFDDSASTLSRAQRVANPILLPSNVNWWSARGVGEVMQVVQNASNRSVISRGMVPEPTPTPEPTPSPDQQTITVTENRDTTISSRRAATNLNSALSDIEADGSDSKYGEMMALIGFPLENRIPACAGIMDTKIILNIDNVSSGAYEIFAATSGWSAGGATWNNVGGENVKGTKLGDFTPSSLGTFTYQLNTQANLVVEEWLRGVNNGVVIASGGTRNGVVIEDGGRDTAKLQVSYSQENCN